MNHPRVIGSIGAVVLALGLSLATAPAAFAATAWWVDNAATNCSNSGPGSADTPFCTISAAAAKAVSAGDTVNVRPGKYLEQVTVSASGASGAPITFAATAPGVSVIGTRDLSGAVWTDAASGTWTTPYAPPSPPRQVFVDGSRLDAGSGPTGLASGQFFYDSSAKVLYANVGGGSPAVGHTVLAGAQTYGFNISSRTNVAISGFSMTGQNNAGVRISGSSAVTVDGVSSSDSGINGVLLEAGTSGTTVTSCTVVNSASVGIKLTGTSSSRVAGCTVRRSGNHGISLSTSSNNVIEKNDSSDNLVTAGTATATGIDVNGTSTDNVLRGNLLHGNQDSGIQVYNGSDRALVVRNISYGNGDHGFDTLKSVNVRYVSNTSYGNRNNGFSVEGLSTGANLRNNIAVDNGLATANADLYVEQTSMTGFSSDRDVLWNSAWVPAVQIGTTRYRLVSEFASATGNEGTGLGQDPNFVNAADHDFRLSANSSAIDSGDASASGFEGIDRTGTSSVDDPNVPDSGLGTPAYVDRGALERVPASGDLAANPPHAVLVLSTASGEVPPAVTVTADASGSSDADTSGISTFTFDFGDGTRVGPQASGVVQHKYTTSGPHLVTVAVADGGGLTSSAQRTVSLSDRPLVTYHVDQADPSCSDAANGTTTPFCTISKAASVALAGDTVLVSPGDYPEQVTPANTGMSTAPLTFRATSQNVRLVGTTDLSSESLWNATFTTAWSTPVTSASPVSQVLLDGKRLARASSSTTTTANSFFYDATAARLFVDVGGANPAVGHTVLASTRTYGFKLWGADTVVVDGFTTVGQNGVGISIQDSNAVVVSGSSAQQASSYGISSDRSTGTRVAGSSGVGNGSIGIRIATSSGATVSGSSVHDNGYHGISVQSSAGATVEDNTAYDNVYPTQRLAAGIDISSTSTDALVQRNTSYRNQDSGIEIYTGSDNALVRRNITFDNGDHGLDCLRSVNDRVVGNTVVGNSAAGINLEGGCSGSTVADNISSDNAVNSTRTIGDIRLDEASSPGSVVDRNLLFMTAGGPLYEWNSTPYSTVESFRSASGQGGSDIGADPQFADLASRDLNLTPTSPAIDSADLGVSGALASDHDKIDPVDVVAVPDTGAGTPPYADRGALEFHGSQPPPPNQAPVAALSATPSTGVAPLTVNLDASASSDPEGRSLSYTFTCGNGTTVGPQTSSTASCTYGTAASYSATVTVTDDGGLTAQASAPISVTPNLAPIAKLSLATPPGPTAPTTATFDASLSSDPEGGALTYTFTCGNGTTLGPQASPIATCAYPAGGTFNARVTVRDPQGLSANSGNIKLVIGNNQPPTASLRVTLSSSKAPATATLDASGSRDPEGGALTYTYTCGNGTVVGPTTSASATCSYTSAGRYTIRLTVTDVAGLSSSTSTTIRL